MFGSKIRDSCKPLFLKHKLLTLPCMYIYEISVFVKLHPKLFKKISDVNKRKRRDGHKIQQPGAATALMQKSILCMAPKIYNKIPNDIVNLDLNTFKNKLHEMLVSKCYYKITEFLNDLTI